MMRFLLPVILILLLLGSLSKAHAHVVLDYPVGGEVWVQGTDVTILWHISAAHPQENWDLYFSSDGGDNWEPIMLNIHVDTLHFTWEVPYIETTTARIRIVQDNVDQDYLDISMNFSIVPNTSPPTLDGPAHDILISCGTNQQAEIQEWLNNNGGAVVTNYCGPLNWTNDFFLNENCGMTGNAWVTFTATDDCGSTQTTAQLIIADTISPDFHVQPQNMVVECNGHGNIAELSQWLSSFGGAQASDACGNVSWSHNYSALDNDCGDAGSTVVTFSATDECGNVASASASFSILDTEEPVLLIAPQNLTLECGAPNQDLIQNWLDANGGAEAVDECGDVTWINDFTGITMTCGLAGNAIVTFTASDACGNTTAQQALVSIVDQTAPILLSPAKDTILNCTSGNVNALVQSWIDRHGGAVVVESCGKLNWQTQIPLIDYSCDTTRSFTAVFTATDDCGNSTSTTASIILEFKKEDDGIDFVDPLKTWTEGYSGLGGIWSYRFKFDTVPIALNGKIYFDLLQSQGEFSEEWGATGTKMRWEDGRVYEGRSFGEIPLYDFTLSEGDTFYMDVYAFRIEEIDSVELLNGELRKRLRVRALEPAEQDSSIIHQHWIEGIGNVNGLMANLIPWSADWDNSTVLCVYESDIKIYDDPDKEECWWDPVSILNTPHEEILIFPNPNEGSFVVPENAMEMAVYSVFGEKIFFRKNRNEVMLENAGEGVFIIVFETEGIKRIGRIVVNH